MGKPLTPAQQHMYDMVKADGSVQKGPGWNLSTARVLAARALVELEVRTDATGRTHFWRARLPRPAAPSQPAAVPAPQPLPAPTSQSTPAKRYALRIAVRNATTGHLTYVAVNHFTDAVALRGALVAMGMLERFEIHDHGTYTMLSRKFVWHLLAPGVLREFVCAGDMFHISPNPEQPGCWEAVHLPTGNPIAYGADDREVEDVARLQVAALHKIHRDT